MCRKWFPAKTGKYFFFKSDQDRVEFIFIFSLLGPRQCGRTFRCTLCMTQRHSRTNLSWYLLGGVTVSFLNSSGVIYPVNSIFLLNRGKKSFQAKPDIWALKIICTKHIFLTKVHLRCNIRTSQFGWHLLSTLVLAIWYTFFWWHCFAEIFPSLGSDVSEFPPKKMFAQELNSTDTALDWLLSWWGVPRDYMWRDT